MHVCIHIKEHSGFILTVYMVYSLLMLMQSTQRKMHTYKDTVASLINCHDSHNRHF